MSGSAAAREAPEARDEREEREARAKSTKKKISQPGQIFSVIVRFKFCSSLNF